jgi:hypothetical protein
MLVLLAVLFFLPGIFAIAAMVVGGRCDERHERPRPLSAPVRPAKALEERPALEAS